jgi:OPT family oligopeptide transporter
VSHSPASAPAPAPAPTPDRKRTPEEIERHWFENVYQGDRMKQLTLRAVLMGMALGAIMVCSNVYVGLKAGWSMGVAITSCILAYATFAALHRMFPKAFPPFTILENNAMQSAASAGGSMTSAGVVNAIPALLMINSAALPADFATRCLWLIPWVIVISWLGVFLAVPAKRQMINVEQLPFPTGTAAAATLRTLHGADAAAAHAAEQGESRVSEAEKQARSLGLAALLGGFIAWWRDAAAPWLDWYPKIPTTWGTNWIRIGTWQDKPLMLNQVTMSFEGSLLFIAGGALIGFRQAWSMLLGAVINYMVLAPMMLNAGVIEAASFRKISSWSLWIGVPMMVTSGLFLFFLNWRTVVRSFSTIGAFLKKHQGDDPMDRIEVPGTWFAGGFLVVGSAAIVLGHQLFHIQWWMGIIALLATMLLVVVGARALGETDINPIGPLSKITQLSFGAIAPGNITTNLMTANISAGSVSHAGDLLTDLKSGYLLGANPRQQFLAQFFGVLAGGMMVIPVFFILIPDVSVLGGEQWPAPAALVWRGVAELLAKGVHALHPTARVGLVVGGLVGLIIPILELAFPKAKKFIPSATGLGLAFTINGYNTISFFIGSCLVLWLSRAKPKVHEQYTVPVASGIIAGESLMGVAIAFLTIFKILGH